MQDHTCNRHISYHQDSTTDMDSLLLRAILSDQRQHDEPDKLRLAVDWERSDIVEEWLLKNRGAVGSLRS